jgi:hypothetical protein
LRRSAIRTGLAACFLLIVVQLASATEPDGYVRIRCDRLDIAPQVDPEDGRQITNLRLAIQSVVPLTEAKLDVTAPRSVQIMPLTSPWDSRLSFVSSDEDTQRIRVRLEHLDPASPVLLVIQFEWPSDGGGIASFLVEGEAADGRHIREAVGVAIGHPGIKSLQRVGAEEFPAVVGSGE